jgi:hypothetical protein
MARMLTTFAAALALVLGAPRDPLRTIHDSS